MIRDETRQNIKIVMPIVGDILQYVHSKDRRIKIQPINVGSIVPKWNREGINDGLACLTIDDDVIPFKVKRRFKSLVGEAVNRPHICKYVDAKKLSDSPATTPTITHPKITGHSVSVDLTPLIESCLPFRDWLGPTGKGFISLSDIIPKWNNDGINDGSACLTIDDDIIPIKVKRRFKSLVGKAIEDQPNIRKYVNAKRLSESPATTLTITHPKIAGDSVSVDLTPLIESRSRFRMFLFF
ncbi:unnamed protein product [Mytilus coruscus]|uniref:Mab-21-like nucleotidyltransferase domain-containing protein n=1 Tax=Mytilus coruscus TaxID=42192 RepID=A0A6J8CKZ7_MYTCO|nr:unnamed protein product [Mytilus coruscus]